MAEFVERLSRPATSNEFYYSTKNPFYRDGYGMPNCTCYAWGRFYELGGGRPSLCLWNAEEWFRYDDGYERGQTPRLGAIAVWSKGSLDTGDDGAGHVAVVERIYDDGSILTSNSAWGGSVFYTEKVANDYDLGGTYKFEGFIYHPINFDGVDDSIATVPDPISANRFLSLEEMKINATYIFYTLNRHGWTASAIAGMLGNMQTESTINPGIWENLDSSDPSRGFGLVQWTPSTKYTNWCSENGHEPASMDAALARIEWEIANGEQWISTSEYPMTFEEFKNSTLPASELADIFLKNYERPADSEQPARGEQANFWYEFIMKLPKIRKKKSGLSLWLMYQAVKRKV